MSSSDTSPKRKDDGLRRWQAPPLGDLDGSPCVAEEAAAPPPLTAEQLEEIQRQAWQEGFEQGRREGLQAAEEEASERIRYLDRMLQEMGAPLDELDERVEEELVALAMAVARQLIRREIKTDPGQIIGVIREGIKLLPVTAGNIRLELHPEDAILVRELLNLAEGDDRSWHISEDPTLTRGGCRISNATSRIDATLETRINQVVAAVLGGDRVEDRE